jgi:serine/threonine protein kinase
MAPEGIKSKEFSTKTDVWSFGITVWEIFTESEPHENLDLLGALRVTSGPGVFFFFVFFFFFFAPWNHRTETLCFVSRTEPL